MDSQQNAEQQALITQIYSRARRTTTDLVTEIEAVAAAVDALPTPVTDHGLLSGLGDNDHPQYLLAADAGALASRDTVGTPEIDDLAVTPAKLSAAVQADIDSKAPALHTHTLADVTDSGALAALDTVGSAQIDSNAVTSTQLANSAVLAANIASGAVIGGKIGPDAVETTNIADNAVLSAKIADTSVTPAKLSAAVQANIDSKSLAENDQVLNGNRLVSNGGNAAYLYALLTDTSGPTKTASHICQPSIPRHVLAASEAGASSSILTVGKDTIDFTFSAGSDSRLNGDSGAAGDVWTSQGLGNPPIFAPGIVHSATAPDTSQLWYHTADRCLYQYDSSRSKWLSVEERPFSSALPSASIAGNAIMQQHGVSLLVSSSQRGMPVPYKGTVTGWTWHSGVSTNTRELALGKFDVSAGTFNTRAYSITPPAWTSYSQTNLDVDYDNGDLVGLIAYGTVVMAYPRCTFTFRRRPS